MNNVVAIQQQDKPLTATEIRAQVNTIQHVMQAVMIKDTHYGTIPGTKTPSLYKPGAEKIMATFRLSADPEVLDLSDGDQIRYQVKVRLISPSGVFVGAGIGECSSNEEKYKWRKAVCKEEFEEAAPERKREKWNKGYQNSPAYKQQQIRTEPADLANTILKMAKKRGLIDAVLTATAASDIFTQDVEDLPPEYIDQDANGHAQSDTSKESPRMQAHNAVLKARADVVTAIKAAVAANNYYEMAAQMDKLTDEEKSALWVAPTKGGCFTTKEIAAFKTNEYASARADYFAEKQTKQEQVK